MCSFLRQLRRLNRSGKHKVESVWQPHSLPDPQQTMPVSHMGGTTKWSLCDSHIHYLTRSKQCQSVTREEPQSGVCVTATFTTWPAANNASQSHGRNHKVESVWQPHSLPDPQQTMPVSHMGGNTKWSLCNSHAQYLTCSKQHQSHGREHKRESVWQPHSLLDLQQMSVIHKGGNTKWSLCDHSVLDMQQVLDGSSRGLRTASMQFKQTKEWKRYLNWFWHLYGAFLPENMGRHSQKWPAAKADSDITLSIPENGRDWPTLITALWLTKTQHSAVTDQHSTALWLTNTQHSAVTDQHRTQLCDWSTHNTVLWLTNTEHSSVTDQHTMQRRDWPTHNTALWLTNPEHSAVTDQHTAQRCDWPTQNTVLWLTNTQHSAVTELWLTNTQHRTVTDQSWRCWSQGWCRCRWGEGRGCGWQLPWRWWAGCGWWPGR